MRPFTQSNGSHGGSVTRPIIAVTAVASVASVSRSPHLKRAGKHAFAYVRRHFVCVAPVSLTSHFFIARLRVASLPASSRACRLGWPHVSRVAGPPSASRLFFARASLSRRCGASRGRLSFNIFSARYMASHIRLRAPV